MQYPVAQVARLRLRVGSSRFDGLAIDLRGNGVFSFQTAKNEHLRCLDRLKLFKRFARMTSYLSEMYSKRFGRHTGMIAFVLSVFLVLVAAGLFIKSYYCFGAKCLNEIKAGENTYFLKRACIWADDYFYPGMTDVAGDEFFAESVFYMPWFLKTALIYPRSRTFIVNYEAKRILILPPFKYMTINQENGTVKTVSIEEKHYCASSATFSLVANEWPR